MHTVFRRLLTLAIAILFAAVVIPVHAQSDTASNDPVLLSEDEAYRRDAQAYVEAFGGTVEEAIRRLKLQIPVAELEKTLQDKEADKFAGLWIEHLPRFRVVVQLTKGNKQVIAQYVSNEELLSAIEVRAGRYTHGERRGRREGVVHALGRTRIPFEAEYRVQDDRIAVYVTEVAQLQAALQREGIQLPENVDIVAVEQLAVPQVNRYGGSSLNGCTSGLSVKNGSGTKYSSSAGHCSATQVSPLAILTGGSFYGGAYDFSVLTVPSGDVIKNWVADNTNDATPYYREITSYTNRGAVGSVVCKKGASTNYTCGTIADRFYSYQGSATFILVNSTSTTSKISCGGDSGAAWYSGNTAHGNHAAGWCDLSNNKAIFMPVQGLLDKGYIPMTSP